MLFLAGCWEEEPDQQGSDYNRGRMLENYAVNLIIPSYSELNVKMNMVGSALGDFESSPNTNNLESLRNAIADARLSFQKCTSFEFGPATTNTLRTILSTYPTNETVVNSNISSGNYDLYAAGNISAVGFSAIEFLLYGNGLSDQQVIDLFTVDAEAGKRMAYLTDCVAQCQVTVSNVEKEWVTEGYKDQFINADGKAVGSSTSLMLNAMVLDFERYIRDGKLGIPLGIRSLGVANPEKVEAYYSQKSLEVLKESIQQYQNVFNGENPLSSNSIGFDDYLEYEGATETAANINRQLDSVSEKLNLLTGPLQDEVINNPTAAREAYDEMQKAIVLLKVDLPSAISVLITYQDSDGD